VTHNSRRHLPPRPGLLRLGGGSGRRLRPGLPQRRQNRLAQEAL